MKKIVTEVLKISVFTRYLGLFGRALIKYLGIMVQKIIVSYLRNFNKSQISQFCAFHGMTYRCIYSVPLKAEHPL